MRLGTSRPAPRDEESRLATDAAHNGGAAERAGEARCATGVDETRIGSESAGDCCEASHPDLLAASSSGVKQNKPHPHGRIRPPSGIQRVYWQSSDQMPLKCRRIAQTQGLLQILLLSSVKMAEKGGARRRMLCRRTRHLQEGDFAAQYFGTLGST